MRESRFRAGRQLAEAVWHFLAWLAIAAVVIPILRLAPRTQLWLSLLEWEWSMRGTRWNGVIYLPFILAAVLLTFGIQQLDRWLRSPRNRLAITLMFAVWWIIAHYTPATIPQLGPGELRIALAGVFVGVWLNGEVGYRPTDPIPPTNADADARPDVG